MDMNGCGHTDDLIKVSGANFHHCWLVDSMY